MLTTGLLLWAQVHRIGILASWPGPAKGQPLVGSNLMIQATTRKGAARCMRPKSCSWEAAFASSFIYSGRKPLFTVPSTPSHWSGCRIRTSRILTPVKPLLTKS